MKLKMSYKTDYKIKGFYEYVVPLEGFWWQDGIDGQIMQIRTCLIGFPLFACPILLQRKILNGQ